MKIITDVSDRLGEVVDQGDRGTCLVIAATAAHELLHELNQPLCVEWLYYHTIIVEGKKFGEWTTISGVTLALMQSGQPDEFHWPYVGLPTISSWNPPHDPQPRFYAVGKYDTFSMKKVELFIKASQPVIVTMTTDQEFRGASNNNGLAIVEHNPVSRKNIEMHAVLVVGYGTFDSRNYIKVRNSWGKDWGDYGYAWVSEEYFKAHARFIHWLQKVA